MSKFDYAIKIKIAVSMEDTELLMAASRRHYDGVCRYASQPNGVIFGLYTAIDLGIDYYVTDREIQTMIKCLEVPSDVAIEDRARLTQFLFALRSELVTEYQRVQAHV